MTNPVDLDELRQIAGWIAKANGEPVRAAADEIESLRARLQAAEQRACKSPALHGIAVPQSAWDEVNAERLAAEATVERLTGIQQNGDWPRYLEARERAINAEAELARAEAERDAAMEEARHLARAANWEDSLPCCGSAASLTRVTQLCDGIDEDEHAIKGTGSIDFGRGMAHASKQFRAALAGGTSPEPTEPTPAEHARSLRRTAQHMRANRQLAGAIQLESIAAKWESGEWPRPVDVASEPPNPPTTKCYELIRGMLPCTEPAGHEGKHVHLASVTFGAEEIKPAPTPEDVEITRLRQEVMHLEAERDDLLMTLTELEPLRHQAWPVGEPLKPTEQEQR